MANSNIPAPLPCVHPPGKARSSTKPLTQSRLKELLRYLPTLGIFLWQETGKGRRRNHIAGGMNTDGYIAIRIGGRTYKAHRLAWLYVHGAWPAEEIDHLNHVRHDNRLVNLREATRRDNGRNQSLFTTNTSGVPGVRYKVQQKAWQADIKVDGRHLHLGYFPSKSEAIAARKAAEKKHNFHSNHGASATTREREIS